MDPVTGLAPSVGVSPVVIRDQGSESMTGTTRRLWRVSALAAVLSLAGTVGVPAQQRGAVPKDVEWYLLNAARFTPAEVASLEAGKVISRVEAGSTEDEVMAVAVIKINAPRDRVVAYYGQMVSYVDGQVTLAFGKFSMPPALADVKDLSLAADDIDALKSCKPGDCDLKLGGVGIAKARASINWNAPNVAEQVNALFRQSAVDYVSAYLARGDAALATYQDGSNPVSLASQWKGLLAATPYFHYYSPALQEYLADYPHKVLPGGRDIFYWVREKYTGLKQVTSLVHAVVYDDPKFPDRTTVAQKQLYASHYYEGSLALASVVSAAGGGAPASYILYVNRSRGDLLKGGFGGLKRTIARSQAQKSAEQTLTWMKKALEQ
jgi:hypothetical protein